MTDYCEIVEDSALAQSSCPNTDVVMVQNSTAAASSTVVLGFSPPITTSTATATEQVTIDSYALLVGTANGEDDVSHTLVVSGLLISAAKAASSAFTALSEMAISSAHAEDEIAALDIPVLVMASAQATSLVTASTVVTMGLDSSADARSHVTLGLLESVSSTSNASSAVILLRRAEALVVSSANAADLVFPTNRPQTYLLISEGDSSSMVLIQHNTTMLIEASADSGSSVWFKNTGNLAWVLNTETTAASWYDNFDFDSILQPPGKVLAIGADGIYELTGNTDEGEQIDAEVVPGMVDFGAPQIKRIEYLYFGYTSEGRISVTPEVLDSGHSPTTYYLEQRAATAPRNSRVEPGKGLWGRYWRMTIRNVDGADFEVHDATVDVAVSSRRV